MPPISLVIPCLRSPPSAAWNLSAPFNFKLNNITQCKGPCEYEPRMQMGMSAGLLCGPALGGACGNVCSCGIRVWGVQCLGSSLPSCLGLSRSVMWMQFRAWRQGSQRCRKCWQPLMQLVNSHLKSKVCQGLQATSSPSPTGCHPCPE